MGQNSSCTPEDAVKEFYCKHIIGGKKLKLEQAKEMWRLSQENLSIVQPYVDRYENKFTETSLLYLRDTCGANITRKGLSKKNLQNGDESDRGDLTSNLNAWKSKQDQTDKEFNEAMSASDFAQAVRLAFR
jgi:hypothetical protein